MNSIIPDQMQALRAWWMLNRPHIAHQVRHAYDLGGYDVIPNVSISLDDLGLEFVRTFNLKHRRDGFEFRIIWPEDLVNQLTDHNERLYHLYDKPGPVA